LKPVDFLKNECLERRFLTFFSWDKTYKEELENFNRHGIVGDVWFGDDIMMKIVR
jgi:hypothetical protein